MTFVFLVEDGTGLVAGANSYVSLADANDYLEIDQNTFATWDGISAGEKERFLVAATRLLDQKSDWEGVKTVDESPLRWPRACVFDRDDLLLDDDVIPPEIESATIELAKHLINSDLTTGQDVDAIKKLVVDVIEIEFQDDTRQVTIPTIINSILGGIGVFRIGGRGSANIRKA